MQCSEGTNIRDGWNLLPRPGKPKSPPGRPSFFHTSSTLAAMCHIKIRKIIIILTVGMMHVSCFPSEDRCTFHLLGAFSDQVQKADSFWEVVHVSCNA